MAKAKKYTILKVMQVIEDILKNEPDIATREINSNIATPEVKPTNFYQMLPIDLISGILCPAVSIFSEFKQDFRSDSSASDVIDPKIRIDVCYENFDLAESIKRAYMFSEDIRETLKKHKGLNGNVADCFVTSIEEIGLEQDPDNPFRFSFRIYLQIKTR